MSTIETLKLEVGLGSSTTLKPSSEHAEQVELLNRAKELRRGLEALEKLPSVKALRRELALEHIIFDFGACVREPAAGLLGVREGDQGRLQLLLGREGFRVYHTRSSRNSEREGYVRNKWLSAMREFARADVTVEAVIQSLDKILERPRSQRLPSRMLTRLKYIPGLEGPF